MSKYLLQKSEKNPLRWILTDTENQIVCQFLEGEFNETQKFTTLNDVEGTAIAELPGIVRAMTDWLAEHHYELVFSSPQRIKYAARDAIGAQLRAVREAKGLTQRDLAKLTGIAFSHIGRIERGRYNMTIDTISIMAAALGVEIKIV